MRRKFHLNGVPYRRQAMSDGRYMDNAPRVLFGRCWTARAALKPVCRTLTNFKDGALDEIANSGFDPAPIDLARDGKSGVFTPLRRSRR